MKVLELFSGIGGMHMAFRESGICGNIVAAIEINTTANEVYKHNFPHTLVLNQNIEGLTSSYVNKLGVDTILMSPPCQPFTRIGLKGDMSDSRTSPFVTILKILPGLNVKYVLIENVKGFETSNMRQFLVETLEASNFTFQEFLLCPSQFGVPNSRCRYYCIVKKLPETFRFQNGPLMQNLPDIYSSSISIPHCIDDIIDKQLKVNDYQLSDTILDKRLMILDICFSTSKRSCCFTKAYGRYIEGTGSVYSPKTKEYADKLFKDLEECGRESGDYLEKVRSLDLRCFTPNEVCKLMSFPKYFSFPESVTKKQRYMLLGNSINVKVVSELLKVLVD